MRYINFNGSFLPEDAAIVRADNRGLRYGDGLFETIRVVQGEIRLGNLHFERLLKGVETLKMKLPDVVNKKYLEKQVHETVRQNQITGAARVRLMLFRGEGGLNDADMLANFLIEAWELDAEKFSLNIEGLNLGIYREGVKACDLFSNIKSNNFLVYAMGALYASENNFDDCIVLNSNGGVSDSTIANIFWIKDEIIYTPPLSEGCVAGVMRRHLLQVLPPAGYRVTEQTTRVDTLMRADEIFLTNAIRGIRWVRSLGEATFNNSHIRTVFSSTFSRD